MSHDIKIIGAVSGTFDLEHLNHGGFECKILEILSSLKATVPKP